MTIQIIPITAPRPVCRHRHEHTDRRTSHDQIFAHHDPRQFAGGQHRDPEPYTGGRNFGHLAYAVDNIYDTCSAFITRGVTINRPPRDGRMAFIRTPDGISIELLQAGEALAPAEPWTSMANTGSW